MHGVDAFEPAGTVLGRKARAVTSGRPHHARAALHRAGPVRCRGREGNITAGVAILSEDELFMLMSGVRVS